MEQNIIVNEGIINACKDDFSNTMGLVKEKLSIYLEEPKVFPNGYEIEMPGYKDNLKDNLKRSSALIFDFIAVYRKYESNEEIEKVINKASDVYSVLEEASIFASDDIHKSLKLILSIEF
ncbi:hypothetical protein [Clostridium sp.]|uniref:hypothetical protein n=1 Tax=Clostridium sp. TaxID=1506 RepID=UPI002634A1D3|nr:hypothetical protein [Clostridium sp.]